MAKRPTLMDAHAALSLLRSLNGNDSDGGEEINHYDISDGSEPEPEPEPEPTPPKPKS